MELSLHCQVHHRPTGMMLERLTRRQREVADLVAIGLTNKGIATRLGCGVDTVEDHVAAIVDTLALDRAMNLRVQITRHVLRAA